MIEIKDKSKCSGRHACYSICPTHAIEMVEDEKGFKYPVVDKEKCINCGLCEKVCPILNIKTIKNEPVAYACYNKIENIRKESSSGGIFTLLANKILEKDGVVFGASFNNEFMVEHTYVEKKEDLYKFRGSKYLQSVIGESYKKAKEFLDNDRYVLFTGTPCQIEGLLSYLRKDYEKLFTQDIICHGVPSPLVWKKYLAHRKENDGKNPLDISFRNKDDGWKVFNLKIQYNDNFFKKSHNTDTYMQAFLKNVILRDSCYACSFKKINRLSDITLADFWGIEYVNPKMFDNKGTSLVIVNSEKGRKLFNDIQNEIIQEQVDINEALKYNSSMTSSVRPDKNRENFFLNLDKMDFDKLVNKYTEKPSFISKVVVKCKRIVKRILKIN